MSSIKNFIKDIGIIGVTHIIISLGGLILLPLFTKLLGAYSYGLWQQVLVTVSLFGPFITLGLTNSMLRFLPAKKGKKEQQEIFFSILFFMLVSSICVLFLLIIFSSFFADAFFDGVSTIPILCGFLLIFTCMGGVCLDYFRSKRQVKIYSIFKIIGVIGEILVASYIVLSGYGILEVIIAFIIFRVLILFATLLLIIHNIGFSFPNFSKLFELIKYGLPLIPTQISAWIISSSDRYFIGYLLGVTYVGFYSAGYGIGTIIQSMIYPVTYVLTPTIAKLSDENKIEEVRIYLKYIIKFFLLLLVPAVFGLTVLSRQILIIMTTSEIADNAWIIAPIVAVSILLAAVAGVFRQIFLAKKKTKIIGIISVLGAFINISLNLFFIPLYGIIGAAVTTLIAYGLVSILTFFLSTKEINIDFDNMFTVKVIISSISIGLIAWLWNPVNFISLFICISCCVIIYFSNIYLLNSFTKEEIYFIKSFIKIRKK